MKIKQIEWYLQTLDAGSYLRASLPFGFVAEIAEFGLMKRWTIWRSNGRYVITYHEGREFTLTEARKACQKAWEGLVKEALEDSL